MELLSLIAIIGLAMGWRQFAGLSSGPALLHACAAAILFLYVGALAGALYPASIALLVIGLGLLVTGGLHAARNAAGVPIPLVLLALFCLVHWFIHNDSSFFYYDEYSHWGVYLRDMLAHAALWGSDSNAMHPRNLPGASLFQYFFAVNSSRPEGAAFLAQFVLVMSPLMVLWQKLGAKSIGWILGLLLFMAVCLANFGHGMVSIYIDHVLGVWFAGLVLNFLYELFDRSPAQLATYVLPLAAVVLFKSTGFFYVLALSGIFGLLLLVHQSHASLALPSRLLRSAVIPVGAVALSVMLMLAWNVNRDAAGIAVPVDTTSNLAGSLVERDSNFSAEQQSEITRRFIEVLFKQQISKDELSSQFNAFSYPMMPLYTDRFRLTTFSFLALAAVALLLQYRLVIQPGRRLQWAIASGLTWLTAVAYIGVLFMGYRFIANDQNGLHLSSYIRYAHSMLLPLLIVLFAPLVPAFRANQGAVVEIGKGLGIRRTSLVFAAAFGAFFVVETPYLKPAYTTQQPPDLRLQLEPMTLALRQQIGEAPLWVYFPNNMTNGFIGQLMQFQLSPGRVKVEEDMDALTADPDAIRAQLADFDYAWFIIQTPEIDAAIEKLTGGEVTARIFRVEKDGADIRLAPATELFRN